MSITARFYVAEITSYSGVSPQCLVKLNPAYSQGSNKAWAAATPSGKIEMVVGNPEAVEQFKEWQKKGANLGITFEEVPVE